MRLESLQSEAGSVTQKDGADSVSKRRPSKRQDVVMKNQNNTETADLYSQEVLRESPEQWCDLIPGIKEIIATIDSPLKFPGNKLTKKDITKMNQLAQLSPQELLEKIKAMEMEIHQLSIAEEEEMTRARLLGIFDRYSRR